ncbi:hypothetical protein SK128_004174 [Halocaridina rubra]|uniref:Uncharacterized protein n=1 Tax=Halocaridina rubra TaxID=373956 RepID=A0AAN8WQY5_HALRR
MTKQDKNSCVLIPSFKMTVNAVISNDGNKMPQKRQCFDASDNHQLSDRKYLYKGLSRRAGMSTGQRSWRTNSAGLTHECCPHSRDDEWAGMTDGASFVQCRTINMVASAAQKKKLLSSIIIGVCIKKKNKKREYGAMIG